jgi:hypothetical protein
MVDRQITAAQKPIDCDSVHFIGSAIRQTAMDPSG